MFSIIGVTAPAAQGNPITAFLPLILLGGVFYFILIRPQQKRAKAARALQHSVDVGDEILTTAGIYGTITAIDEEDGTVTVEIAPNTQIKMVRGGVAQRLTEDEYAEDGDEDDDDDDPAAEAPPQEDAPAHGDDQRWGKEWSGVTGDDPAEETDTKA